MVSFLYTEREQASWRFLLLWVFATNVLFFLGLGVELLIFGQPNLYIAVPLAGIGQAYVINRHLSIYLPWAIGTAIFWLIGLAIAYQLIHFIFIPENLTQQLIQLAAVSAFAGLLAGIPQWIFMRDWLPKIGLWWLIVSAISWAVVPLPGIIIGLILMRYITQDKIPMENRHYQISTNRADISQAL